MDSTNDPNPSKISSAADHNVSSDSVDSRNTRTESNTSTPLNSRETYIQSPHTSTGSTSPTQHVKTLISSDLRTATLTSLSTSTSISSTPPVVSSRPAAPRRTSTITWQDTHETNTTTLTVPPILKKEVASSKAGRMKPAVEKLASWFKGSPVNLEEIEEAREDDRKWKRRVREWKEMRDEVGSLGGSVSGSEKGYVGRARRGSIGRVRRKLGCW